MMIRYARATAAAARRFSTEAVASVGEKKADLNGAIASIAKRGVKDSLGRRLFSLAYAKRSALVAVRQWGEEGNTVRKHELNRIVKELRKVKRHKHALEICEWMTQQPEIKLLSGDYAVQLDLIAKNHGLAIAEKFFEDLPDQMKDNSTFSALLHTYVQNKETAKAETLFEKMSSSGYLKSPHPYNRMLSLYISTGQLSKVARTVQELKESTVPDVVTYNLFLSVCASRDDVDAAEEIFRELKESKIKPDWVTFSSLTTLYIKNSLRKKAVSTLKEMEKMASRKNRTAYSSIISLYTNLEDKDGVQRIWKKMKDSFRKMSNAEYTCIISSFVKLGEFEEAEKIYSEWESISGSNDSRVSNTLLAAYINKKDITMVEKFHNRMVEKGITPSYTTWELLTWAYLKDTKMENALDCFKKAVCSVKKWVPDDKLILQIFKKLEDLGDVELAEQLLTTLREAGHVSTKIYNLLLKIYAKTGKTPLDIAKQMEQDDVELDEETRELMRITGNTSVSDVSTMDC